LDVRDPNGGDKLTANSLNQIFGEANANAVRAGANGIAVRQNSNGQTIEITEARSFWAKLGGSSNPYRLYPLTTNVSGDDDVFSAGVGLVGTEVNGEEGLDGKIVLVKPVNGQNFFEFKRYGVWQPDNRWVTVGSGGICCPPSYLGGVSLPGADVSIVDASNGDMIATGTTDESGRYAFPLPWLVSRPINWTISKTGMITQTGTATIPTSDYDPGHISASLSPEFPNGCFLHCCKNMPIKGPLDLHIEGTVRKCVFTGTFPNFTPTIFEGSFDPQDIQLDYIGCKYIYFIDSNSAMSVPVWSTPYTLTLTAGSSSSSIGQTTTIGPSLAFWCMNYSFYPVAMLAFANTSGDILDFGDLLFFSGADGIFKSRKLTLTCSPLLATGGPYTEDSFSNPCVAAQQEFWGGVKCRIAEAP